MKKRGVSDLIENKKSFAFFGGSSEPSDAEKILTYAINHGMLDLEVVHDSMQKKQREEYIKNHKPKIWQTKGRWYTYLPEADGTMKIKSRADKEKLLDDIAEHYHDLVENPTVKAVFTEWINRKLELGKISPSTHYRYLCLYKRHMEQFGRRKIRSIDEDAVLSFLEEQVPKHNLTSKGFSNLKTAIRGTFKYARRKKYTDLHIESILQETDVTEIRFRHQVKEDIEEVYTEDESARIFEYLTNHLDEINICILLMFVTGLRVGEAVTLKHEDIGDNYVNVRRTESRYKRKGEWVREIKDFPKTLAGWRSVAVPDAYTWVLDKTRTLHPFDEFVFARENGLWMSTFTVRTRLAHLNKELGIVAKSPHKIRKTYGSILLDNGIDQKIVMVQMGHADIVTTERAYHRNRRTLDKRQKILSGLPEFQMVRKA